MDAEITGKRPPSRFRFHPLLVLIAVATSWVACVGIPLRLPELGLDPSWQQALVETTDSGRVFGRDLVFTYGPLHQVATHQVSRFLFPLVLGRVIYGLAWFCSSLLIGIRRGLLAAMAFGLLVILLSSRQIWVEGKADVMVITLGLAALLLVADSPRLLWKEVFLIIPVGVAIGVAPLIKLSFLAVSLPVLIIMFALPALASASWKAFYLSSKSALIFAISIMSIPLVWFLCRAGSFADLLRFFAGPNLMLVQHYSEAMSLYPALSDVSSHYLLYLTGIVSLALAARHGVLRRLRYRLSSLDHAASGLAVSLVAVALILIAWAVFKFSFVRHDIHVITAGMSLISAAVLLAIFASPKQLIGIGQRALLVMTVIMGGISGLFLSMAVGWRPHQEFSLLRDGKEFASSMAMSLTSHVQDDVQSRRRERLAELNRYAEDYGVIKPDNVSADIFPWDVSSLLANQIVYRPRPVPQSYSAYHANLQDLNASAIANRLPDLMIVGLGDIDGRLPVGLDGSSFRIIFESYELQRRGSRGSLIFIRCSPNSSKVCGKPVRSVIESKIDIKWRQTSAYTWISDRIALPADGSEGWLSLKMQPTLPWRIMSKLFKPPPLFIDYLDGSGNLIGSARVLPFAIKNLLVSPLLVDSDDLVYLLSDSNRSGKYKVSPQPSWLRLRTDFQVPPFQSIQGRLDSVKR